MGSSAAAHLQPVPEGNSCWWAGWPAGVMAGITTRQGSGPELLARVSPRPAAVEAEQVHGASVAAIEGVPSARPVAGCDAFVTSLPHVALLIRTADCIPLFFVHPARRVIGLAHAGWRGVAAGLPAQMVQAFRTVYHASVEGLRVAVGPAIRACCYEVGPEFEPRFPGFVRRKGARLLCDLVGAAVDQLRRCGVQAAHVADAKRCTHCEAQTWFSLRREGQEAGRLVSLIALQAPVSGIVRTELP